MTRHIPTEQCKNLSRVKMPAFSARRVNFLNASFEINLSVPNTDIDENLITLSSCEISFPQSSPSRKDESRARNTLCLPCDLSSSAPYYPERIPRSDASRRTPFDVGDGSGALRTYLEYRSWNTCETTPYALEEKRVS